MRTIEDLSNRVLRLETASTTRLIDQQVTRGRDIATPALLRIKSPGGTTAGTGFFISADGYLLTADHISHGLHKTEHGPCAATLMGDIKVVCELVQDFPELDLSLMKVGRDAEVIRYLRVADTFRADTTVAVIGFGLEDDALIAEPNLTVGQISTVLKTKMMLPNGRMVEGDDAPYQLFTANVNKGVSGAPVFDVATHDVVGVFTKLRKNSSEDQGQALFTAVTAHTNTWAMLEEVMAEHRLLAEEKPML